MIVLVAAQIVRHVQQTDPWRAGVLAGNEQSLTFTEDEWSALQFLHDETPLNAIVVTNRYPRSVVVSGIGGRAAFLEYQQGSILEPVAQRRDPEDQRLARIAELWSARESRSFCGLLLQTRATYLLEGSVEPLAVATATCMHVAWRSPLKTVTVWQVDRTAGD